MRRLALLAAVLLAIAAGAQPHARGATSLPNVVMILVDDMPALDGRLVNYMPTLKTIRDTSVTFSDFNSETPLCCPARAGYLTGQHTLNHGVTQNVAELFNPAMTLATQLHGLGYFSALVGKYLNHYEGIAKQGGMPPGWDRMAAFGDPAYYNYDLYVDGSRTPTHYASKPTDYSTDVLQGYALNYLRSAPITKSVFLWIAPNAPHAPTTPAPRYSSAPGCDVPRWKPPNYNEADVSDKPLYVRQQPLMNSSGMAFRGVCRTMLAVDELVKALRSELTAEGRLNNTIFVFAGDNGMLSGEHRLDGKQAPYVTAVPFYVSWPQRLGTAPRIISERVQNIDFAPTICSIVGCTLGPYPNAQLRPDGRSFSTLLFGTDTSMHRDAVLEDLPVADRSSPPAWYSVVTTRSSPLGLWQYTEYATGERELYDLSNGPCWTWKPGTPGDPCELQNVASDARRASLVVTLRARLDQLKHERGVG